MKLAYRLGWLMFRSVFATYFRWRIIGVENVPETGPLILAANHTSYIDPPLVGTATSREIHYLARESLFAIPVVSTVIRAWNAVPVDRDGGGAAGLKAILDRLLAGGAIIVFPEGTRSPNGLLQPFRAGIGLTVIKSSAPLVPVRVFGAFEAFNRHHRFPRPRRVTVVFGRPMNFENLRRESKTCARLRLKAIYAEATEEIRRAIEGTIKPVA